MSLKHAILSLLLESEQTGYDLNKSFQGSIAYYWSASHQQIYKTLADMLEGNWVKVRLSEQNDKPDKKIYTITDYGKEELEQWALQSLKPTPSKDAFLIKLLLVPLVGAEPIIKQMEQRLDEVKALQESYKNIEKEHFTSSQTLPIDLHVKHLTLRCGIEHTNAEYKWLREALEVLRKAS